MRKGCFVNPGLAGTVTRVSERTGGLAREFRPRRFDEVRGQEGAKSVLSAIANSGSPAQQILLAGPSGTGKTTLARIYVAAICCTGEGTEPCGECQSCGEVMSGTHTDVYEVDAASHGGVDNIRDLSTRAQHAPAQGPYRFFIIDEAHGLTSAGGQAFLKLLEEPPTHAVFILATTDPQKLPVAVRSRCLSIDVQSLSFEEMVGNVLRVAEAAGREVSPEAAALVVAATDSDLGVRGTVVTLDKLLMATNGAVSEREASLVLSVADENTVEDIVGAILDGYTQLSVELCLDALNSSTAQRLSSQLLAELVRTINRSDDEDRCANAAMALETLTGLRGGRNALLGAVAKSAAENWRGLPDEEPIREATKAEPVKGKVEETGPVTPSVEERVEETGAEVGGAGMDENEFLNRVASENTKLALEVRRAGVTIQGAQVRFNSPLMQDRIDALKSMFPELSF